jgi:hypothetical protein
MKKAMIMAGAILLFTTTATAAPFQWADFSHLVTLTTADDNDIIWNKLSAKKEQGTRYASYWPRGYQTDLTVEPFGHWGWVTGEAWTYKAWPPNKPNNGVGEIQQYLHHRVALTGEWDDTDNRGHMGGYVVEFGQSPNLSSASATIPSPEPATMLLLGFGLIGLAGLQRKILKK